MTPKNPQAAGEYVLVPRELTFEMRGAIQQAFIRTGGADQLQAMHTAMLAAAPALAPGGDDYVDADDVFLSQGTDDVPCLQVPGRILVRFVPGSWGRAYALFSGNTTAALPAAANGGAVDDAMVERAGLTVPEWERGIRDNQQVIADLRQQLAAAIAERDRAVKEATAARDLAEQWNADARAEGFGGGAVKARDLLDAMNAAIAAGGDGDRHGQG